MKYKQKVTELLKTVPEIKKSLEELKFGCKIILNDYIGEKKIIGINSIHFTVTEVNKEFDRYNDIEKIIGNPLEERLFRMYCKEKGFAFAIGSNGKLMGNRNEAGSYSEIQLDNTKSFDEQSEEIREQFFNFLNGLVGK